ncbi:MAG: hypothetical protein KF830_09305 [Planctomycetes bacterium]|nr:hypothetical protein [Planctomycetota bacterium]
MVHGNLRRLWFGLGLGLWAAATLPAQNSTRKLRVPPSELAARAGQAVPWRDDVDAALAEAGRVGKPVFWYVPAVQGSPMDRKDVIDRYLMGGPFSWPSTIDLLRDHFVPVKAVAGGARAKELGLVRGRFVEPGYVVLDGAGEALAKLDQITTFHPQWFEAPLRRLVGQPLERFPGSVTAAAAWARLQAGDPAGALTALELAGPQSLDEHDGGWLRGVLQWRTGRQQAALETWRLLARSAPEHPLAWKAALEVEGHGPFRRGFEVYGALPAAVLATPPADGSRAPEGVYAEADLWPRCLAFLLGMDDGDGVVRDSTYDFGGTDSLPNVHAAITCLVGEALLAAVERQRRGELDLAEPLRDGIDALLQRIRANVERSVWLALSDRDEILWARAYAVRFLVAWQRVFGADAGAGDREPLRLAVGELLALQPDTGVWFHEYGNPFAIATALQALAAARDAGAAIDRERVDRGLRALAANRTDRGAFTYSHTARGRPRASVEAAAGRMPLCELGLFLHGASDAARLLAAVEAGLEHHALLAAVRKYDDHADAHGYGGFFFWFDMLGRAEAIARIDDAPRRRDLAAAQRALVLALPEFDGCFVDSHELGRSYGTAMALLCLHTLAPAAAATDGK